MAGEGMGFRKVLRELPIVQTSLLGTYCVYSLRTMRGRWRDGEMERPGV